MCIQKVYLFKRYVYIHMMNISDWNMFILHNIAYVSVVVLTRYNLDTTYVHIYTPSIFDIHTELRLVSKEGIISYLCGCYDIWTWHSESLKAHTALPQEPEEGELVEAPRPLKNSEAGQS